MKSNITLKSKLRTSVMALSILSASFLNAQAIWEEEAEDAFQVNYAKIEDLAAFSGGRGITEMSSCRKSEVKYYVMADEAGAYDLVIYYATMQERYLTVAINNQIPTVVCFDVLTGGWSGEPGEIEEEWREGIESKTIQVYLERGENVMTVAAYEGYSAAIDHYNSAAPNLDRFEILPTSVEFQKPADQIFPIVIEAENAEFSGTGGISTEPRPIFSGQNGAGAGSQGAIIFNNIEVEEEGAYALKIYYATMQTRWMYVKVNDQPKSYREFNEHTNSWGDTESDDPLHPSIYHKIVQVYLEKGKNSIILGSHTGESSEHADSPNIDKIEIIKVNAEMEHPGYEINAFPFDYTDLAELTSTAGGDLELINDNNEFTIYKLNGVQSAEFVAELPYPIMLTGYAWASSNNTLNWEVESSTDGQNWVPVGTKNSSRVSNFYTYITTNDFETPNAAKYFKLKVSGSEDIEIGEWQLYGMPYISSTQHFPDDLFEDIIFLTCSEDGFNRDGEWHEVYENSIDKLGNTKYTIVGEKSLWLQYEFNYPTKVETYSLTVPYAPDYMGRNPRNWQLSAYDGELGDWIEIHRVENMEFPSPGSTLMFNIDESGEYYAYKLNVSQNAGADDIHMAQWQLFADRLLPDPKPCEGDDCVGIEEEFVVNENSEISVYNQGKGIVINSELSENVRCTIYNVTGQIVSESTIVNGTNEISISSGLYIVVVNNRAIKVLVK